jgi:hypothetical protein
VTRRHYASEVIPIVWPDGRWVGFLIHVGNRWFGPFASIGGARLAP